MNDTIDYYFTSISPFAWLGQNRLVEIASHHGKDIRYKPVSLAEVWKVSGAFPLAERPPVRQRYRLIELQRIAELRGLSLIRSPTHFPTNPALVDHCIIAIQENGGDPGPFFFAAGEALWTNDRQIADEDVVAELLSQTGHDARPILEAAKAEATAKIRAENTKAAIAADAIGSPCYVYRGEPFWGQDRLDLLDAMIASDRPAFAAG